MTTAPKMHELKVTVALKWVKGDEYEAKVSVQITDSCYHPGNLTAGLPPGTAAIPEVETLTFNFTHDEGKVCSDIVKTIEKTITVISSSGKQKVTAFAVVNGVLAGSDTKPFPRN